VKDAQGELEDEKAGETIAEAESKDEPGFTPDTGAGDPAFTNGPDAPTGEDEVAPEPEDKTKSYDQWLAEQAEKRLALGGGSLEIRKPNEGSKQRFPEGTAVQREEENFFIGGGGKQRKQKEAKEKDLLVLEGQYYANPDQERGGRGGRGGPRGGRGDGRGRGRGEGRGRGGPRGGDRGAFRGGDRGDRSGECHSFTDEYQNVSADLHRLAAPRGGLNPNDESAFPSLGGK
jgi:plasminogen activator inhibitor 1 RNA-binding protein